MEISCAIMGTFTKSSEEEPYLVTHKGGVGIMSRGDFVHTPCLQHFHHQGSDYISSSVSLAGRWTC